MAQQDGGLGRTIFFIGAGCSVSAGVPAVPAIAQKMAMEIATKFRTCASGSSPTECYSSLLDKDRLPPCFRDGFKYLVGTTFSEGDVDWYKVYDACFDKHFRSPDDVRDLFGRILKGCNNAINWAHLCLGELAAQRYISTTLTTNFDQLVLTGMASAGLLPVVCDGLESLNRLSSSPSHQQLVELHGSRHTYRLRNRPAEVAYVAGQPTAISSIIGLFNTATTFVAIGYGGREDGVMDLLIEAARAYPDKNLYWVTYSSELTQIGEKVRSFLSYSTNSAVVPGQDADEFFLELCKEMGIGAPSAVREPLGRYRGILEDLGKSKIRVNDIAAEVTRSESLLRTLEACERDVLHDFNFANAIAAMRELRLRGEFRKAYEMAVRVQGDLQGRSPPADLLHEHIVTGNAYANDLAAHDPTEAIAIYRRSLEMFRALLELDTSADNLGFYAHTLRLAGNELLVVGEFGDAKDLYGEALALDRKVADESGGDPAALAALADSYQAVSDILSRTGDLAGAIEHIRESVSLRLRRVEAEPGDVFALANLSMGYDRMGDAVLERGDLNGARENYEAALAIDEKLAKEDPGDLGRQRNLAIAYSKLGDLLRDIGEIPSAKERYAASLLVCERLLSDAPKTGEYKRDLSIAHLKLGDIGRGTGAYDDAAVHYQAALSMMREIAAVNPRSAIAARDVSVALNRMGRLSVLQENFDVALTYFEESLGIDKELSLRDADYTIHQRDAGVNRGEIGQIYQRRGEFDVARQHYLEALEGCERHAAINSVSAEAQRDLSVAIERLASVEEESGQAAEALALYERSLGLSSKLADDHPENPTLVEDRRITLAHVERLKGVLAGN